MSREPLERREPREPVYVGQKYTIRCLELADGSCPAGDFLDNLGKGDRAKLTVLFTMLGDTGHISNREKFKKVEDSEKIFEFKSHQIRLFCFFDGKEVLLGEGLRKKQDKHKRADIERAEEWRRWYFSTKRGEDV